MSDHYEKMIARGIATLATLAVVAALYFGAEFLIPIALAIILNALLRPVVRSMERARIPTPLAASIVVLVLTAVLFGIGYGLASPVKKWITAAPEYFSTAEAKLRKLRAPLDRFTTVVDRAEKAVKAPTSMPTSEAASQPADAQDPPRAAQPPPPAPLPPPVPNTGFASQVVGTTTQVIGGLAEVLLLLFLLLASGGMFWHKLAHTLRRQSDKQLADEVVSQAEYLTLRYVTATATINVCQASMVGLFMWWFGMPAPLLWAIFTFVFEWVPYLGAAAMIVLLAATSLATFDSFGRIVLPPLTYFIVTTLQNNLVSPYAYGRQLRLNPVAVLIGVLFWWYVWGVAGAFLAVPIMAVIKVFAGRQQNLRAICEFLSE
ncbi:MAG TPA: AI-2E family transporter [Tepidisphaeraceae bacterium]|jgi:predicted PurR-regulated permease PerM|nr:AI-2E family transporter [Tepidisphaeraceae bacterium]